MYMTTISVFGIKTELLYHYNAIICYYEDQYFEIRMCLFI